jgi:hypothetical protein
VNGCEEFMGADELYWTKVAALGQVAGAAATFLAVLLSLYLATYGRRPRLKLTVGERLIITQGQAGHIRVLNFSVANAGERPVHIRGIGWRTGWLRWGPAFLRTQAAVQLTGGLGIGKEPPYELQPGAEVSSFTLLQTMLGKIAEKAGSPFFARDWPVLGRRRTRIRAYAYTADGYTFRVKAEPSLSAKLYEAELLRKPQAADGADGADAGEAAEAAEAAEPTV